MGLVRASVLLKPLPKNYRTRDHLIPRHRFPKGTIGEWNTVFACRKCNFGKAGMDLEEFRLAVRPPGGVFWAERMEKRIERAIFEEGCSAGGVVRMLGMLVPQDAKAGGTERGAAEELYYKHDPNGQDNLRSQPGL